MSDGVKGHQWYNGTGTKTDFNTFLKFNLQLLKNVNFYADLQFRGINYDITGIDESERDIAQNHKYTFFNPKLGTFIDITSQQNLYLSIAVAHREPTRDNLTGANPANRPTYETLNDFEAGYNFKSINASINLNYFYMDYNNQLVNTGAINEVGAAVMTNVSSSYRTGVELSVNTNLSRILQWSGILTISKIPCNN